MEFPELRFVIYTGFWSEETAPGILPSTGPEDFIACADGGYAVCARSGAVPDIVIGDFDSLPDELNREIENLGIRRIVHGAEKDATDTILCIKYGIENGFNNFLIIGGIGGSFGHTIANIQALSFLADMECKAEIVTPTDRIFIADGEKASLYRDTKSYVPVSFSGRPGANFSVLSHVERSSGVAIKNARYELEDAVLTNSYPIGVSNEFINTEPVTVSVRFGRLLIIADR